MNGFLNYIYLTNFQTDDAIIDTNTPNTVKISPFSLEVTNNWSDEYINSTHVVEPCNTICETYFTNTAINGCNTVEKG